MFLKHKIMYVPLSLVNTLVNKYSNLQGDPSYLCTASAELIYTINDAETFA